MALSIDDVHEVLAELVSLAAPLLTHPVVLPHAPLVLLLVVLDSPTVLFWIVKAVPSDRGRDQLRVELWVWSICYEPGLPGPLDAQLNMKLLALGILRPEWLE